MKKGLEMIGMPVMGIKEGIRCGIAKGFAVDAQSKKISTFIIQGDRNDFDLRMLETGNVMSVGRDYIVTKSVLNVKDLGSAGDLIVLLGMKCVSGTGDVIGNVKDFDFDEKSGDIETLQMDSGVEIDGREILTITNDLMFLSNEITFEEQSEQPVASAYEEEQRKYLLGKVVHSDITDAEGKVLINQGAKITEDDIEAAKKAHRITELTLSVE